MKTVIFFRHGKSDWDAAFDHDHQRPLSKRGRRAARTMGRFLTDAGQVPDRIVTSSAVRAQETLKQARKAGGWNHPERVAQALYEAEPDAVLEEIRKAPDDANALLLVGHEPTWSETISRLVGGGRVRVPTAAMARVDMEAGYWSEAAFGEGQLSWLVPPRLLA